MTHRILAAALLAPRRSGPRSARPPPKPPAAAEDLVPVAIDTSLGRIVVALDAAHAPITTANFLRYVDTHRFDGENFYRAMHAGDGGLIQGGVTQRRAQAVSRRSRTSRRSQTGLKNVTGAISMANAGPGHGERRFLHSRQRYSLFDATTGATPGFAAFGHVTEGMDVVKQILAAPFSPTAGEGPMKGQCSTRR